MVGLDILQGAHKLVAHLLDMMVGKLAGVYELLQAVAIDIVANYAAPDTWNILEIVDHHDIRVRQIITGVKLPLYHLLILR